MSCETQTVAIKNSNVYSLSLHSTHEINTVNIISYANIETAQNDTTAIYVLGRLRPYNQDYLNQNAAEWFLQLYKHNQKEFHLEIAGFFVLIIVDKVNGTVNIVNDHVGSIPCYVNLQNKQHLFISDSLSLIKESCSNKLNLNTQAFYNYVYFHCIPSPISIYKNVYKLEPGVSFLINAQGNAQTTNYYQPDFTPSKEPVEALQRECYRLISEAVRRNIIPDCAAFLSGGLDSSTVAGFLATHSANAKTYSIGFEAKGYDETEYAMISAKHFKTHHKVHYLKPDEIAEHFQTVAGAFNEPFGNSSAMAAYICAKVAAADGIKVMLAGDGGDEIFAGNERYVKQKVFEHYNNLPSVARALLDMGLYNKLAAQLPVAKKAYSYINQAKVPLPDRLDNYNFLNQFNFNEVFSHTVLNEVTPSLAPKAKQLRYHACPSKDAVDSMMYLDWKFTLADNDLVKVSTMTNLAGIEVRYPLFEKELVDFSCTVPASIKAPGQKLRDFYKQSFKGFLPDATLSKSKHGFGLPFGVWMKQHPTLQSITEQSLVSLRKRNIIQSNFIDKALETYQHGHSSYYGELVWIMVTLELWLQQHEANYVA